MLISVLILLLVIFVGVLFSESVKEYSFKLLGLSQKSEILKFVGIGMGGVLVALQALMSYKRAKAMEDTAKAQANAADAQAKATEEQVKANQHTEQGQRQDRLKNAIEHLGHEKDSVRLGGAYELFHLAEDTKELRQTVLDILCAHIRQATSENEYREAHKSKPSEEVQSLLTLLFVQEHEVFKDLRINLQGSYLNGANLNKARMQGANLQDAYLQGAFLCEAHLQEANLEEAHLQGANLVSAHLREARLEKARLYGADLQAAKLYRAKLFRACLREAHLANAHLQGANLQDAYLQEAFLAGAHMQGAYLGGAYLQGAYILDAQLQGANFLGTFLQGTNLEDTQLQGAELRYANLHGVNLRRAQLQGAFLGRVHLQGACLEGAQLQGVSGVWKPGGTFEEHIGESIGKETDLSKLKVVFEGGLRRKDVDYLVKGLSVENLKKEREKYKKLGMWVPSSKTYLFLEKKKNCERNWNPILISRKFMNCRKTAGP